MPGDGRYRVQPLHVCDPVKAVLIALECPDLTNLVVDIDGGEVLTFDEVLDLLALQQGKARGARNVHISWKLMALIAAAPDLPDTHRPITGDEPGMLRREHFTPQHTRFVE